MDEAGEELRAVEIEIDGSRTAGALRIDDSRILGSQVPWPTPELESKCLRSVAGEDIPHSVDRCGPPACGIYAVKDLAMFPDEVAAAEINHTVVGVVAASGKVIEHRNGYRAQRARAIALSIYDDGRRVITDDPRLIAGLFRDPEEILAAAHRSEQPSREERRAFLDRAIQEEEWI